MGSSTLCSVRVPSLGFKTRRTTEKFHIRVAIWVGAHVIPAGPELAAIQDLAVVRDVVLVVHVEQADLLGALAHGPRDAVDPHLRHHHALRAAAPANLRGAHALEVNRELAKIFFNDVSCRKRHVMPKCTHEGMTDFDINPWIGLRLKVIINPRNSGATTKGHSCTVRLRSGECEAGLAIIQDHIQVSPWMRRYGTTLA